MLENSFGSFSSIFVYLTKLTIYVNCQRKTGSVCLASGYIYADRGCTTRNYHREKTGGKEDWRKTLTTTDRYKVADGGWIQ